MGALSGSANRRRRGPPQQQVLSDSSEKSSNGASNLDVARDDLSVSRRRQQHTGLQRSFRKALSHVTHGVWLSHDRFRSQPLHLSALLMVVGTVLVLLVVVFLSLLLPTQTAFSRRTLVTKRHSFPITIPVHPNARRMYLPHVRYKSTIADYGDLDFESLKDAWPQEEFARRINPDDYQLYHDEKHAMIKAHRHYTWKSLDHDDEADHPQECERVSWRMALFLNCNILHELHRNGPNDIYLGHGYYRDTWLMYPTNDPSSKELFVLKQLRHPHSSDDWNHEVQFESLAKIQLEAVIMERLTGSPRIVSSLGHCGTSIMAEHMPYEIAEHIVPGSGHAVKADLDNLPYIRSKNNYTSEQKLSISLEMARSIADLHGFDGGVMIHGDVHPVQWLLNDEGQLKMNDFNNGVILDWNITGNRYCKFDRGAWGGMYRAPEEFIGTPIDEKIDVYSMGNNIYTLITGLWPFYEDSSYSVIQKKILKDLQLPYIDPRWREQGYIERRLIEIMEKTWAFLPVNRPTIFEVIQFLEETAKVYKRTKNGKEHTPT